MTPYREFQFSWLIVGIFVPAQFFITFLHTNQIGTHPMSAQAFWGVTMLFAATILMFYGMTTTVDEQAIRISFGLGLIRKRIQIERIKSVEAVTSPWYYGYGIRLIPNGWLYNVSGERGVELRFLDRKRVIRIGTKDPGSLKREIEKRRGDR